MRQIFICIITNPQEPCGGGGFIILMDGSADQKGLKSTQYYLMS